MAETGSVSTFHWRVSNVTSKMVRGITAPNPFTSMILLEMDIFAVPFSLLNCPFGKKKGISCLREMASILWDAMAEAIKPTILALVARIIAVRWSIIPARTVDNPTRPGIKIHKNTLIGTKRKYMLGILWKESGCGLTTLWI